ncbi:MAG TPA: hypothetical protein PLL26_05430 [Candidatus Dojkabacteria bacterium]|nr:hypothetical protein [Candidatus Dojkabacteria bacterium]
MSIKEKFCKYSKHPCPDCNGKLKIINIINDEGDVFYTEKYEVCGECGYQNNITDKRNNNNKVEIKEVEFGKFNADKKRCDAPKDYW